MTTPLLSKVKYGGATLSVLKKTAVRTLPARCPINGLRGPRKRRSMGVMQSMSKSGEWEAFLRQARENEVAAHAKLRMETIIQCDFLIDHGWKWELPDGKFDWEAWQWYWRRPPRRKGSKGMKFWSTQQAFNHLSRSLSKSV